ncbi:MAG: diguanylate cyclase [Rhodocyclaceae bacterium]|nr:diguanylate cyclase [Rhodocyclaceae bacterium]
MLAWLRHCFGRYLDSSPLVLASGLTLLCLPAVLALAWMETGHWQKARVEEAVQREMQQTERQLTDAETDIESAFERIRSITNWVAEEGHTLRAILDPKSIDDANMFLQGIASSFGLDLIYVLNTQGISVASSNWDTPTSTIGADYSDREHFKTAIAGIPGYQFAVGRTTLVPGFFFSLPIRKGTEIVGTVGIKTDQPRLQSLVRIVGGLVSDQDGIVVLAENPKYMFAAMPGNTADRLSPELRMRRYARTQFKALPLKSAGLAQHPEIMLLDGVPVVVGKRTLIDAGLTINVVSELDAFHDMRRLRYAVFGIVTAAAVFLLWGIWLAIFYALHARDYRRRLELANRQLSHLNAELHEQATQDFLTGTHNRRAFNTLLNSELERVKRYGGDLSLGLIDIDYFKRINDSYGHEVGDQALKFLVQNIGQRMRRSDVLARLGGEEFVLLMPNTSAVEAVRVIDRMREAIAALPMPGLTPELRLTFSAGVTGWRPGIDDHALLNAADAALYAAKGSGRNRVLSGAP